jgi:hypothetical protein
VIDIAAATDAELDKITLRQDRKRSFLLFRDLQARSNKQWLVHNLLGTGEASCMFGKPGDGKSVLAEDLALHVAAGWQWHGRRVKRGAVIYIALERRKLVERRAIAFRERHNPPDLPFAIVSGVHDFRDKRTAQHFIELAGQLVEDTREELVLICIDTLSRALCGGDENSPKDMGAIVAATALLQQGTGAHVEWIHHTPIDAGERLRGHGALLGAMDTTISVAKTGTVRTATVVKANDSEEGEQVAFTLESVVIGQDDTGQDTTAPVVVPTDAKAVRSAPTRKLSDRNKLALAALGEAALALGKPAPASFQLPAGINAVQLEQWKDELFKRNVLDHSSANPRKDFIRIREALAARMLIGLQDGLVWPV